LPDDYEKKLKDEIYGCFKYIGIPIETVYHMPVQDRRYFIMRHNAEQEHLIHEQEEMMNKPGQNQTRNNGNLNAYAKLEQQNNNRRR
jgi:hypothetical protein